MIQNCFYSVVRLGATLHQHGHVHGHSHGQSQDHGHSHKQGQDHSHEHGKKHKKKSESQRARLVENEGGHSGMSQYGSIKDDCHDEENVSDQKSKDKKHKASNLNVKAAFIHVLGDFCQSVGVFIAALIIYFKVKLSKENNIISIALFYSVGNWLHIILMSMPCSCISVKMHHLEIELENCTFNLLHKYFVCVHILILT